MLRTSTCLHGFVANALVIASPASCVHTAASGIECFRPLSGKLMSIVAPHGMCRYIDATRFTKVFLCGAKAYTEFAAKEHGTFDVACRNVNA